MKKSRQLLSFVMAILMIPVCVSAGGFLSFAGDTNRELVSAGLTVASDTYGINDEIEIRAVIRNNSTETIRNVTISCGVPKGFSLINGTVNAASYGSIEPGSSRELIYCIKYPGRVCKTGDVNDDGKVSATDARLALRASAGLDKLTDEQLISADANGDGKIMATDARTILRVCARIDSFAAETVLVPAPDSVEYDQESYLPAEAAMIKVEESLSVNGNLYDIRLYARYELPETTVRTTAAPTTATTTEPGTNAPTETVTAPTTDPVTEPSTPPITQTEETTTETIAWYTNPVEGGVEIAGIAKKEPSCNYEIPAEINGQPVVGIGADAFRYENIRSIALPDALRYIGHSAFYSVDALTSITIPASVAYIDTNAFTDCDYLACVYIEAAEIEIASFAFSTRYQRKVDLTIYAPPSTDLAFRAWLEWDASFVEWYGETVSVENQNEQ